MPDKWGWNWLRDWGVYTVACIDCDEEGPVYRWPEEKRQAHFDRHESARRHAEVLIRRRAQKERVARLQLANRLKREAAA